MPSLHVDTLREKVRARLAAQRLLVRELLRLREQLAGSLFVRYSTCGKSGCACAAGERHGPYYVLSTGPGRGKGFRQLSGRELQEARQMVLRHRRFRSGLVRLRKLNVDLTLLLGRYQRAMAGQGERRLALAAARSA
jgi:hypothetical protein